VFTNKAISEATGVTASTIAARAKTVANVMERAPIAWPTVLHSSQRREAIRTREVIASWRADFG
jgi:hypothetical protein